MYTSIETLSNSLFLAKHSVKHPEARANGPILYILALGTDIIRQTLYTILCLFMIWLVYDYNQMHHGKEHA